MLNAQGEAYGDFAEVLLLAGKSSEAAAALEQALDRYERKGNLVSARRAHARLAEVPDAAPRRAFRRSDGELANAGADQRRVNTAFHARAPQRRPDHTVRSETDPISRRRRRPWVGRLPA